MKPFEHSSIAVFRTIQDSGFEPEDILLVGGGVVAIHGLRYTNDVDLWLKPKLLEETCENMTTPSGIALVAKYDNGRERRLLSAEEPESDLLPLDLFGFVGDERADLDFELAHLLSNRHIRQGGFVLYAAGLRHVRDFKKGTGLSKDRRDIELINEFLEN